MVMTTEPTDAEILDLWELFVGEPTEEIPLSDCDKLCFARAALRSWGQPSGAGEAAEHYRNAIASACEGWTMPDGLRKHLETALWSQPTPQPTQPQAVAVTDAQVLAAVRVVSPGLFRHGLQPLPNDGANTAAQMRKEADTVRKMLEAAHGIKGGQHGTE